MSQRLRRAARAFAFLATGGCIGWMGCSGDTTSKSSTRAEPPQSFGPPGTDVVSAGGVATSTSYRLVFTVGQSTQNQDRMSSTSFRLHGGVIGANEGRQ
ncbi:hypothetical protein [Chondromyces apiculatus]|uniref:Uncharacterized protein n=1 Tax=Chondromyces apiculatus DSM 436 TaxID=1192034 RepID=A0A017TBF0_9BACT|nr:hypothetical protein [Chondromyces apiculatus]EYF06603.1 Hypothetical protein CAP_1733 [Chondromyces apiculatus DSM 436]